MVDMKREINEDIDRMIDLRREMVGGAGSGE